MEQESKRLIYETLMGERCSDVHWWRVKRSMAACELPLDKQGFELFINLRKTSPKHYSQFHKIKAILDKKTADIGDGMTGREFIKYLEKEQITPHQSTLSRWFVKAGGYKAKAFYAKAVLIPITALALIYQHRSAN